MMRGFHAREKAAYDAGFVGAHAINQTIFYNSHPTGALTAGERLDALMEQGGIQNCCNAKSASPSAPSRFP